MNRLTTEKRVQIIHLLVEGNSLRSTSRIADVSINTVTKLLVDVGKGCQTFHDHTVNQVRSKRVQCDEIWCIEYGFYLLFEGHLIFPRFQAILDILKVLFLSW
jgi:uncharacterized protein YjaG (DUF416 family)